MNLDYKYDDMGCGHHHHLTEELTESQSKVKCDGELWSTDDSKFEVLSTKYKIICHFCRTVLKYDLQFPEGFRKVFIWAQKYINALGMAEA